MARYHYWQFIVNQMGQPIENVNVYIFKAGTETPVTIYTSESGSEYISTVPQAITNRAGFFEFWIEGAEEENLAENAYALTQKFKLEWDREGIISGRIDNLNIFPILEKGQLVPPGGAKFQILGKLEDASYDTGWFSVGAEDGAISLGDMLKEVYDEDELGLPIYDVDSMIESETRTFFAPEERIALESHIDDDSLHRLIIDDFFDAPEGTYPGVLGTEVLWSAQKINTFLTYQSLSDLIDIEFKTITVEEEEVFDITDKDMLLYDEDTLKWKNVPFSHGSLLNVQGGYYEVIENIIGEGEEAEIEYEYIIEQYHLNQMAYSHLADQDQSVTTDSDVEFNSVISQSGVQVGFLYEMPGADLAGTLRYRKENGNSWLECCMQVDNDTYEWVIIKHNVWEHEEIT